MPVSSSVTVSHAGSGMPLGPSFLAYFCVQGWLAMLSVDMIFVSPFRFASQCRRQSPEFSID